MADGATPSEAARSSELHTAPAGTGPGDAPPACSHGESTLNSRPVPPGDVGADEPLDTASHAHPVHPVREILTIALPSVATMTSYTLMQFVDGLMVSRITPRDDIYLSAQGNGGMAVWILMSTIVGLAGIINTYVAQNLGAGRPERGSAYAWQGLWIALAAQVLLVPYLLALPSIFASLGHEARLVELETGYARVLLAGAGLTIATRALAQYFYGLHRPWVVLGAAVAGNITNIVANAIFIFGLLGAPRLGVIGAAVGTVIASVVELAIPLAIFLGPSFNRTYRTRAAWRPSVAHLRDIVRLGWPGAVMIGNEMACWGYFMVGLVGALGTTANTASWIALRYMQLSFMPMLGVSFAMTAIVGKYLGMRRPDLARRRAWLGLALAAAYMTACAGAFVAFPATMIRQFTVNTEVVALGASVMILAAIFQLFDGIGIALIGVLRGAGDTIWPGVVTVILAWSCIIGGGAAALRWAPGLGALGPWAGASLYIVLLGCFLFYRFVRGEWLRRDVLTGAAGLAQHA